MACQLCHAQPYKSCFSCHTQESASGAAYFTSNGTDPTRAARTPVATPWLGTTTYGLNALVTNPKYGVALGAKKYAVLRHVPVDGDVFTYDEEGTPMPGLIPGLSALPTWKYATPHNIVRSTAITSACDNCHGASYTRFWLTDPYADAFGWVPATPEFDFEGTGNAPYRVTAPIPMAP
jgi:thiosulfate/3-mercaptopyruvate sulfurtransferase